MADPSYLRERARELRMKPHHEIADRLVLPKTTVYTWIDRLRESWG